MISSRQAIRESVLNLISTMIFSEPINGAAAWVTVENRLKLWGDVPTTQQPAVYLTEHRGPYEYRNLALGRRRVQLQAWCYARTDDRDVDGQDYLDTMMDSFEAVFQADMPSNNLLTLNRQVYWCRIEGVVFNDPGDIDNQAMLIVPILVEMP